VATVHPAASPAAAVADPLELPIGRSGVPGASVLRKAGGRIGVGTVRDLLFHLPRRYEDLRQLRTARDVRLSDEGTVVTARLVLVDLRVEQTFRRRIQRTIALLRDETGDVEATWFGRRYIERRLRAGDTVVVSGRVRHRGPTVTIDNPEFQRDDGSDILHAGRIVPVYRLTAGLSARTLRTAIRAALDRYGPYRDYLGADERPARLPYVGEALEQAHYPETFDRRDAALERLAFDELLALQVGMVARGRAARVPGEPIAVPPARVEEAVATVESVIGAQVRRRSAAVRGDAAGEGGEVDASLDGDERTRLTRDQVGAVEAILRDLRDERPMLRLLQGDVGSGKTAVAALAMTFVADAARQAALLAPTDLLARQHAETLGRLLEPLGHGVTLLTGSMPAHARREALELLGAPLRTTPSGESRGFLAVGTHALVQDAVHFADLRLAVVDEQHRFGVAEREALAAKGTAPHVLLMTATPIPRTLAQVVHADLDVSDLRAAPTGRQPIATAVRMPHELVERGDGRPGALPLVCREVAAGRRAFVVVPLVDPGEVDPETGSEPPTSVEEAATMVRDAWERAATLGGVPGTPLSLGEVHGRMKAVERDETMDRFRRGELSVLVGTTVLEVGVDVPEASVMVILDAERFGVAQLHQLRGRVGRGEAASYCVLVSRHYPAGVAESDLSEDQRVVRARLDALVEHQDGFVLAEKDFELRREGELLGLQQSGLPPFRVASLAVARHRELSVRAREVAETIVTADGRLAAGHEALEQELATGWLRRIGAGEVLPAGALDG
jgi:ATP-dependent DNA helicase RecG